MVNNSGLSITDVIEYGRCKSAPYYKKYGVREGYRDRFQIIPRSTREDAEIAVIARLDGEMASIVRDFWERGERYGRRCHAGALLFFDHGVEVKGAGYLVRSESKPGIWHAVYHDGQRWVCDCADWYNGLNGIYNGAPMVRTNHVVCPVCKHIFAIWHYCHYNRIANYPALKQIPVGGQG